MLLIGDLEKRITLQYRTRVADGMGGFTETWADGATVWAKKTTHRSNEAVQSMQQTGIALHNYRIHWRRDVSASWRIKEGNKYMAIVGPPVLVNEGPGRRYLDITAQEATR